MAQEQTHEDRYYLKIIEPTTKKSLAGLCNLMNPHLVVTNLENLFQIKPQGIFGGERLVLGKGAKIKEPLGKRAEALLLCHS